MSILTNLIDARIDGAKPVILGKTISRPTLAVTDGTNETWCVDVDIGQKVIEPGTLDEVVAILRNVPLASNNRSLVYADVGSAVELRRATTGRLEVTGFAKSMPGHYNRYALTVSPPANGIPFITIGPAEPIGLTIRKLTLIELSTVGPGFGICPLGAYGVWRGDELLYIRA